MMSVNRRIFKVEVSDEPFEDDYIINRKKELIDHFGLLPNEIEYLYSYDEIGKDMYNIYDDKIEILEKDGKAYDVTELSDMLNIETLSKHVKKHYFCYQRI